MLPALRFFYLLLFIVIASQGIFYFLAVGKALQLISLNGFMEQRKVIEQLIEWPLKVLYYTSVALAVSLLILYRNNVCSVLFFTTACSLAFLLADVFFALTKSVPLNTLIRNYTAFSDQELYEGIRTQWLCYIKTRGLLSISGLLILLSGFMFAKKMV